MDSNGAGNVHDVTYYNGNGWNGNDTWLSYKRDDGTGQITSEYLNRPSTNSTIDSDMVWYSQSGKITDELIDGIDPAPGQHKFTYDAVGRLKNAFVQGHAMGYSFLNRAGEVPGVALAYKR